MSRRSGALANYLDDSRRISVSLTFVLPLLLGYELGLIVSAARLDNAIGLLVFKRPLQRAFGTDWMLAHDALLLVVFLAAYLRAERVARGGWELYAGMLLESTVYAGLLGVLAAVLPGLLVDLGSGGPGGVQQRLLLSIGAGVYEELLFRLVLLGGLLLALERWAGLEWRTAALAALVLSSTAFAAVHYVGPRADRLTAASFAFRYLAGVLLGLIYLRRGLGIAVYTHALYDILVVLGQLAGRP